MDSFGEQEGATYRSLRPVLPSAFPVNQFGAGACSLRPGNVHSATVGVTFWNPSSSVTGNATISEGTPPSSPGIYDYLEAEGFLYAIRLPTNQVLSDPLVSPNHGRRITPASAIEALEVGTKAARGGQGGMAPRRWFPVAVSSSPTCRGRLSGWCRFTITVGRQNIKEGKNAIKWTRCPGEIRLLVLAATIGHWLCRRRSSRSLTTLRETIGKIGAKVVRHGRRHVAIGRLRCRGCLRRDPAADRAVAATA